MKLQTLLSIICISLITLSTSCERKPFVEHKLKFEKVSDNCKDAQNYFRMNSNFGGERYEFEKCLPAGFTKEQLTAERQGDTVLVSFNSPELKDSGTVFHITLDIDSYPTYHYLTIGRDTYSLTRAEN